MSLCHIAAPFPLHNPVKADGLTSSAPSAANEVRTPRPGVRHTATCPALSYTPHLHTPMRLPPLSPVPSALQTPRTRPTSFFVVQITDFDEFRIRGLLVHLGARCVCVPVFLYSYACWSTCFVLPPPPPPLFCPPSSHRHLIPVFREMCVFWKCVWKCPQDGECGSRVGRKHSPKHPPPCQNHCPCSLVYACFIFRAWLLLKPRSKPA